MLTLSRVALAGVFAALVAVWGPGPVDGAAAAGLLLVAAVAECTDMLDGWAARRTGTASELGGLLDPLCDSLSRLTMFFAAGLMGWVWLAVPLTMAGRDIIVAYVRIVVGRAGGNTSARTSGKIKAFVQGGGIFAIVLLASRWMGEGAGGFVPWARAVVSVVVMAVTLWSLADYVRGGWPAIRKMMNESPRG